MVATTALSMIGSMLGSVIGCWQASHCKHRVSISPVTSSTLIELMQAPDSPSIIGAVSRELSKGFDGAADAGQLLIEKER
jgi:hypothetical protein